MSPSWLNPTPRVERTTSVEPEDDSQQGVRQLPDMRATVQQMKFSDEQPNFFLLNVGETQNVPQTPSLCGHRMAEYQR